MKTVFLYLFIPFLFFSCNGPEEEVRINLEVTEQALLSLGEIDTPETFSLRLENDTAKCVITTAEIYENDALYFVHVSLTGNKLFMSIATTPAGIVIEDGKWIQLEPDGWIYDVKFNITGLKNQYYNTEVQINGLNIYKTINTDLRNTNSFTTNLKRKR